ncbi:MAG: hypothetical protein J7539_10365 [Niabella sp.]|nr:hypothetical protein [Niabella sp.]
MQPINFYRSPDGDTTAAANNDASNPDAPATESSEFLFVDLYSLDLNGAPAWDVLAGTPGFYGAILKAAQGIKGWSDDGGWFNKSWQDLRSAASDRYGDTWFRGAYLFLNFWQDGAAQADNYLDTLAAAGNWDTGDIIPIIDVELGQDGKDGRHKRNPNQDASTQQIIDCTTACADKLRSATGRNIMLYGRGAMRDKSINDKMGCDVVWNPCYTASIVMNGLEAWTLDDVVLWQYCGDGTAALDPNKFPRSIPDFGAPDISVYIEGSNKPSLETLKQRLGIGS